MDRHFRKVSKLWKPSLVAVLLLLSIGGSMGRRTMFQADNTADNNNNNHNSSSSSSSNEAQLPPVDADVGSLAGKQMVDLLQKIPKNMTGLFFIPRPKSFSEAFKLPENYTLPKLKDITFENGMTALEFAKALMTGTISTNTADTNTPDKGLSDVQSGAININPFMDGAAMSNALTLAGREATANAKGIVFGLVGTGRSSNEATALGVTGAKSSTDTFVINGGGLNQNAMSSNLAATPQGAADTSVRSAAFNIIGAVTTGGLTNAVGKKGADSAGLGAGMTGLGDSYGAQFSNSLAEGDASSNTGLIAGTLTGASRGTVGSIATSAKKSAESQALSTTKSAIGSSTSKSAAVSTAAQNATSNVGSDSFSGVGNSASYSSTTASGLNAVASASSKAKSEAGAANSIAVSKAQGVNSATSSSNATSSPSKTGIRNSVVQRLQLKLPSVTISSSRSSSSTFQAKHSIGPLSNFPFLNKPTRHSGSLPTTAPLLGEALISTVGLKALLPSVPKIVPQLPTLNQTITVEAAPACNETEINLNRTADEPRLTCNATLNATEPGQDPTANLPGLKFFDNLKAMNEKFKQENMKSSPSPSPKPGKKPNPPAPEKKPGSSSSSKSGSSGSGGGSGGSNKSTGSQGSGKTGSSSSSGSSSGIKQSPKPSPKPGSNGSGSSSSAKSFTKPGTGNKHSPGPS